MLDSLSRDGRYQSSESRKAPWVPFGIYALCHDAGVTIYLDDLSLIFYYKDFLQSKPGCHPGWNRSHFRLG